ncbi:MAG: hypothetical protein HYY13_01070 [Nitrospirae bacterium]|nr:hypothetical protein [Nitrospirota bacterium]
MRIRPPARGVLLFLVGVYACSSLVGDVRAADEPKIDEAERGRYIGILTAAFLREGKSLQDVALLRSEQEGPYDLVVTLDRSDFGADSGETFDPIQVAHAFGAVYGTLLSEASPFRPEDIRMVDLRLSDSPYQFTGSVSRYGDAFRRFFQGGIGLDGFAHDMFSAVECWEGGRREETLWEALTARGGPDATTEPPDLPGGLEPAEFIYVSRLQPIMDSYLRSFRAFSELSEALQSLPVLFFSPACRMRYAEALATWKKNRMEIEPIQAPPSLAKAHGDLLGPARRLDRAADLIGQGFKNLDRDSFAKAVEEIRLAGRSLERSMETIQRRLSPHPPGEGGMRPEADPEPRATPADPPTEVPQRDPDPRKEIQP